MKMNKKKWHQVLKLVIVISALLGVALGIIDAGGSFAGLGYFTNQANVFIGLVYLYFIFLSREDEEPFLSILYVSVVAIIITGLVYHILLNPTLERSQEGLALWTDILVHSLTPLLVILERLLYGRSAIFKSKHILMAFIFPLYYLIFTWIYASLGGVFGQGTDYESKYPYFFLNFNEYGYGYFVLVMFFILLISYLVYFINHKKSQMKKGGI